MPSVGTFKPFKPLPSSDGIASKLSPSQPTGSNHNLLTSGANAANPATRILSQVPGFGFASPSGYAPQAFNYATNLAGGAMCLAMIYGSSVRAGVSFMNGDGEEVALHASDAGRAVLGLSNNVTQGVQRGFTIGRLVAISQGDQAAGARWGSISQKAGLIASILGVAGYAIACFSAFGKLANSLYVKAILASMEEEEYETADEKRLEYLRTNYLSDLPLAKIDLEKAEKKALTEQEALLRTHIKELKECGDHYRSTLSPSKKELHEFIRKKFVSKEALQQYGKEIIRENFRRKKLADLTRVIGAKGAEVLQSKKDPQEVLAKIDESQNDAIKLYARQFLIGVVGAAASVALCVYTAGLPFLIATILFTGVLLTEAYFHYRSIQTAKQDGSPPGEYDKFWPIASSVISVAAFGTALGLASVFSLGLLPLAVSGVGCLMWLGLNYHELESIEERKKKYIDNLLWSKKDLNISEYAYVLNNSNENKDISAALGKLPDDIQSVLRDEMDSQMAGTWTTEMEIESTSDELDDWLYPINIQKAALNAYISEMEKRKLDDILKETNDLIAGEEWAVKHTLIYHQRLAQTALLARDLGPSYEGYDGIEEF